jgi:hypothetical protein
MDGMTIAALVEEGNVAPLCAQALLFKCVEIFVGLEYVVWNKTVGSSLALS